MSKKLFISVASLLATAAFAVMPVAAQASLTNSHYYVGGIGPSAIAEEGERVAVYAWGTLALTNTAGGSGGKVECHNVVGGWIENPGAGGAKNHAGAPGIGETQSFNPYECVSAACKSLSPGGPFTYISVAAEPTAFVSAPTELGGNATNLGWKSKLLDKEAGTGLIRSESTGVKVNVHCHVQTAGFPIGGSTSEPVFGVVTSEISEGSNRPSSGPVHTSITPEAPFTEFDAEGAGSGELHGPPPGETGRKGKTEGKLFVVGYGGQELVNTKTG